MARRKSKKKIDLGNFEGTRIVPWALLFLSLVYPFAGYLELLSKYPWYQGEIRFSTCELVSLDHVSAYFILAISVLLIWPRFFRAANSAIYMILYPALGAAAMGSWFLVLVHGLLLCPPDPLFKKIYLELDAYFLVACVVGYFLFVKRFTRIGMTNNPEVWDFQQMKYSPSRPLAFRSREDTELFAKFRRFIVPFSVYAVLTMGAIGRGHFSEMQGSFQYDIALKILACYFVAYIAIGFIALGNLETVRIVVMESKRQDRKMTIREFD